MKTKLAHEWCAYKHMTLDGRVLYVGKGRIHRASELAPSRRSAYHLNAIHKHCDLALIISAQPCRTEAEAFQLERQWIYEARRDGHKLCNFTDGGEGVSGRKVSPEVREKIRRSVIKQWDRRGRGRKPKPPTLTGVAQCRQCGVDIPWKSRPRKICSKRCENACFRKPYIPVADR